MSWIYKLYETYENCQSEVGTIGTDEKTPLLPISHSTQNAQVEVVINGNGDFVRAKILEKDDAVTIIPVTENSATRSGTNPPPHPLCDKLQYVAGDYSSYVIKKNCEGFYSNYIEQLKHWCKSSYCNMKVSIILKYLMKRTLMKDLILYKILVCDKDDMISKDIKIGGISQSDIFVRFRVEILGENESAVWLDKEVYESYVNYYLSLQEDVDLCYAMGKKVPCSEKHPSKIRNTADKSKLISANDTSGFTYLGRFTKKNQVVSIGYETSQKAHNALRWLIDKQGYKNGEQVIVAWGTKGQDIPGVLDDTQDIFFGEEEEKSISTEKEFAKRINNAIAGYGCDLDTTSEIIIMGLEAATTGRLSITYYRELGERDFLDRIKKWHSTCLWKHTYKKVSDGIDEKGKPKIKHITFIGAPSPKDITLAAYGDKVNDKLKKATIERMLLCIIDGAKLPYDIVNSTVNRASNPVSMENWEWEKVLTVACALVRKYKYDQSNSKEVWEMALDENQTDRSYVFGRLLAIAQEIEGMALRITGEKRDTNAERLMHQFKIHPYKTWGIITDKLRPYITRLGALGNKRVELMTRVNDMIPYEEFTSQRKLDDGYILGYYSQRQIFIDEKNQRIEEAKKKKLEEMKKGDSKL